MPRNYHQLLPYMFRRFSVSTARRTLVPTIQYYLTRTSLPPSEKPALFTMNILPPLMTVWYHCARKYLGEEVDITIFDCSGLLNAKDFPGARVQKFLNLYAATKCDEFLYHIARNRNIAWICDDDVIPIHHDMLPILQREFTVPRTASISFKPRPWLFHLDGKEYEASGSYCTAFDRSIFVDREHLSLVPCEGNPHSPRAGTKLRRYDTGDKANEILLWKGYRCAVVPEEERERCTAAFTGMSGAVVFLWYCRTPEQVLRYFHDAPAEKWRGSVLFGMLSSLLAISHIQELYSHITGSSYPLPSLPPREALQEIRRLREPFLGRGRSLVWIDKIAEKLHRAL